MPTTMETDLRPLSLSPHAFALTSADVRPAKKRCTKSNTRLVPPNAHQTHIGPVTPLGKAGIWYAGPTIIPDTHGTSNIERISGRATSSQAPYPPGTGHPARPTEPASFDQTQLWLGEPNQGDSVLNTSRLDAEPQLLLSDDATAASSHTLWDFSLAHHITTGSLPYHLSSSWFPTLQQPLVSNQEPYDQLPASAACNLQTSLSTPPPSAFIGTELQPFVEFPLNLSDGGSLAAVQPGYGPPEASDGHASYQCLTQGPPEQVPLGSIMTPTFDQLGGYGAANIVLDEHHTSASLQHPYTSANTAAPHRVLGFGLSGPYGPAIKPMNDGDWHKKNYLDQAEWVEGRGFVPNQVSMVEGSSKPEDDSGGEGPHDLKRRARFDECLRRETSNTRTMGACLRCHNQRVRCTPNKLDRKSPHAPCETCLRVRRDSKKTIHNLPCVRFKVTSMTIYRAGGLGYTMRFDHTKVMDVFDPSDSAVYDIEITQGLCSSPLRLRVRRFKPEQTDKTHVMYMDGSVPKTQDTGAFCLADVEKTARDFNEYIGHNALAGLKKAVEHSDDIVQDVFAMIATHCNSLPAAIKTEDGEGTKEARKTPDEKGFLQKIVRLWFAIRHGAGSAWLCGKEDLGLSPGLGPGHPLPGQIVSRMIVAQFDSIRHERVYKKLAPEVLRTVDTFLTSCNKKAWFTVFLATFLLLHQTACTSQDRYRHVKQNSRGKPLDTRYGDLHLPLTILVEEVHHSAVMLLAHWQYFKRCDLMNFNWDDRADSALVSLKPYQVKFVKRIVDRLKERLPSIPAAPADGCWEHELFWVSKMFVSEPSPKGDWTPPEMFTRAKPSVGRE